MRGRHYRAICVAAAAWAIWAAAGFAGESETGPAPAVDAPAPLITFAAVADGPRAEAEFAQLESQIAALTDAGKAAFLLHLGDIAKGSAELPESYYARVADLLSASGVPVIIVPGDNEWNDLDDPDLGWRYWTKHFLGFEQRFAATPEVVRQKMRPENLAWTAHGVLFIGINLVGGRIHDTDEWPLRHGQNAAWVRTQFEAHQANAEAAVVFCQASPAKKHIHFVRRFERDADRFGRPVLFLHGDAHRFEVEAPWLAPNVTRVCVDQVALAPPLLISVTRDQEAPFVFDRQLDADD